MTATGPGTGNLCDGCDMPISPIRCSTSLSHLIEGLSDSTFDAAFYGKRSGGKRTGHSQRSRIGRDDATGLPLRALSVR